MPNSIRKYYDAINTIMVKIIDTQCESIEAGAQLMADHIARDERLFVIGTGSHCSRVGEEMFFRSGGLACTVPIMDPGFQIANGVTRAMKIERMEGYAGVPLDYYGVGEQKGDLMLLVNAYGTNPLTIDTMLECRKRGVPVIAVTSFEFPASVPDGSPARHSTNQNLFEMADVAIDNFVPAGDAIVELDGFPYKVAASSTMAGTLILDTLVTRTVEILLEKGVAPPVWVSANAPGGMEWNAQFLEKYAAIRHL